MRRFVVPGAADTMVGIATARLVTLFFIAAGLSFELDSRVATSPATCAAASDVPLPETNPYKNSENDISAVNLY
jgi:hypothetical protein